MKSTRRAVRAAIAALLFSICPVTLFPADVVFADGIVDIRYADGERLEAFIGDIVETGDTVITGRTGIAELEPSRGSLIKISPNTVFAVREVETGGEKRSVLSTAIGAVAFTFNRNTDREPLIATQSTVAGIRGTELEVFAGADGSVLMVVLSGKVEVSAKGESVEINANEGVEVAPGEAPGQVFEVLRGQLDFSTWNAEREAKILEDPILALEGAAGGLDDLISEIEAIVPVFEEKERELESLRASLRNEEDAEKRKSTYEQQVFPLEVETSYLALNLRYYALSALSYRRFVIGTIYLRTRSRMLEGLSDVDANQFYAVHDRILDRFERFVAPHLVSRDL